MKRVMNCSKVFFYQITKDMMLFAAGVAPLLAGMAFRFGIPFLEKIIEKQFGVAQMLHSYYGIFDGLLILLSIIMYNFIGAMCVLEELDEGTARYLCVTPLGKSGYLASRLGIPSVLAYVVSFLAAGIFSLEKHHPLQLLLLCAIAMLQGLAIGLMVIALSHNKLEGMALTKLAGIFLLGLLIPYFISTGSRWLGAVFPSFWMSMILREGNLLFGCAGVAVSLVWVMGFYLRFRNKFK